MNIAVGCDHRGYHAKGQITSMLRRAGHHVEDYGCFSVSPCDYPDIGPLVAGAVSTGKAELGILIGGNGMGFCIVANKLAGIRSAVAHDEFTARCTREQHHCNVLCLASESAGDRALVGIVETFMAAVPAGGRHADRVAKIAAMEREQIEQAIGPVTLPAAVWPIPATTKLSLQGNAMGGDRMQNGG